MLRPELDQLVEALQDVADGKIGQTLAAGLAMAGATQTLRAGVLLGHQDVDIRRRMAAALGMLDPLALADLPEARASAAEALTEMAVTTHAR